MSEIFGIPETLAAFGRVQVEAEAGKEVASMAGAQILAVDMRRRAPKDTGQLRASIRVRQTTEGAAIAATVPYARFVEFGTVYMAAEPFMSKSSNELGSHVISVMASVFKRLLR